MLTAVVAITGDAGITDTAVAMGGMGDTAGQATVGAAMDGAAAMAGAGVLDLDGRTGVGATRTATVTFRGITRHILTTIHTRAIVRRDTRARPMMILRRPTPVQRPRAIRQGLGDLEIARRT